MVLLPFFLKKKTMAKKAKVKAERMKLKALHPLTGKYFLPYSNGQEFTIDEKRGQELVDNKDAEIIK